MLEEQRQPLEDDDDLGRRAKRDNFWIQRVFKWAVLVIVVIVLCFLTFYFCRQLTVDDSFRGEVMAQLKNNIIGIIVAGLAVIGINIRK